MREFKFLDKNVSNTNYNGIWSLMAIRVVTDYVSGRFRSGQRITIEDAEYIITETSYQNGELAGAVVKVFSLRNTYIKITYWISMGRVTPFITNHEVEYERI